MKVILKSLIVSMFCLLLVSCQPIEPTYNKGNIVSSVIKLCQEKEAEVVCRLVGSTLWVYFPTGSLIDTEGNFSTGTSEKLDDVFEVAQRVCLSCGDALDFFVIVASDVEMIGVDVYFVGYVQDIRKARVLGVSRYEFFDRNLNDFKLNPQALGDYAGKHLDYVDLSLPKFLAEQIINRFKKKFTEKGPYNKYFTVVSDYWDIVDNEFILEVNLEPTPEEAPAEFNPQEELINMARLVFKGYDFQDFKGIVVFNPLGEGQTRLSRKQLFSH